MHNQRGSVIPAVAFMFGAAVLVAILAWQFWPKDEEIFSNSALDSNQVVNSGSSNGNTNTSSNSNSDTNGNTNTATPTNTNASQSEQLPTGVKRYTSDRLGITFTYLDTSSENASVQEVGDKIYIGVNLRSNEPVTDGQWVQVISKDSSDTLAEAIEKKFLQGFDRNKCYVEAMTNDPKLPNTVTLAIIGYPITDPANPLLTEHACPGQYSKTNGGRHFWMDSNYPDKFLFFDIGQYSISGNEFPPTSDMHLDWQRTVRVND